MFRLSRRWIAQMRFTWLAPQAVTVAVFLEQPDYLTVFSAFARSGPCLLGNSNGGGRAGNTSNSYNNRLQSEGRVRGNQKIDLGGTSQP
jgi:hypothetical protein